MGHIYLLKFANGKGYVGQTVKSVAKRLASHRGKVRKRGGCPALSAAWEKYGEPECVPLFEVPDDELDDAEKSAILALGTLAPFGYNITPGGDFNASKLPEVIEKIRRVKKAAGLTSENLAALKMARENRTPESFALATAKGVATRSASPEWQNNVRAANARRTPEERAAAGVLAGATLRRRLAEGSLVHSGTGKKYPAARVERGRAGKLAFYQSPAGAADKKTRSDRMRGTKLSPETRAKMSASQAAAWARRREAANAAG
jgi:hypothetical protein